MNLSLFSQPLSLVLFGFIVGSSVYLCSKIEAKIRPYVLAGIAILGLVLTFIIVYITVVITQSPNELPGKFWLMIFPLSFGIFILPGILFASKYTKDHAKPKKGRKKTIEPKTKTLFLIPFWSANIVIGLIFALVLTNDYYHYYPTLSTVFSAPKQRILVLSKENKITLQYSNNATGPNLNTIESSIYNTDPATKMGQAYSFDIPGKVSKFKTRGGWLYVPSIAFNSTSLVKMPVLIMLPGSPGVVDNIVTGAGLQNDLEQLAAANHGITPLVYVADDNGTTFNDTECVIVQKVMSRLI